MTTYDARRTDEIKSRIVMARIALSRKKNFITRKLDLHLRKKLVKCRIRSIALYDAEI
jgi:hypothetical protein